MFGREYHYYYNDDIEPYVFVYLFFFFHFPPGKVKVVGGGNREFVGRRT